MVAQIPNIRRGLPRTPGGEPWPIVEGGLAAASASSPVQSAPQMSLGDVTQVQLRRGLPRTPGGEPWPAVNAATVAVAAEPSQGTGDLVAEPVQQPAVVTQSTPTPAEQVAPAVPAEVVTTVAPAAPAPPVTTPSTEPDLSPQPAPKLEQRASAPASSATAPAVKAPKTRVQRIAAWALGLVAGAGIIVLAARGVTTLPGVPEFLEQYPGEYTSLVAVEPGFAPWVRWSHFLNFFFMVLIIRTGLLIRHQQKPDAYFTPKNKGKKVSIYFWLHTSIDVLWLTNGVIFVVLLFSTGHWARIVPTSWEVFPNAISAGLQYLTLEWPHEDGWVNYNSLQQLMYFTVVFLAAPLAALTGVRMSAWWPENAPKLNKLYPAPVARAIHHPVMLFFVLFILVHVFLVFTTGALKNLNHMFAGTPEISWVGFVWFVVGVLVTAAVTWAARPLVIAPIANLFGKVSER